MILVDEFEEDLLLKINKYENSLSSITPEC